MALAQAFTDHYYATFDTNRQNLAGLYQDQSLLTFEGQKFQGVQQVRRASKQHRREAAPAAGRQQACTTTAEACARVASGLNTTCPPARRSWGS